jgi:benzoate membrane transport protein
VIEAFARPLPTLRDIARDAGPAYLANGLIGFVFSATGPVAVVLTVGSRGGLSQAELASWIFGSFFINGLLTLLACWLYRMPLAFFWTIPGTVLVGPALAHLRFAEIVGAFLVTGLLMLLLGASGWVRRAMNAVPMPIVMAMVAGVFLRFGTDLVRSLHADAAIAAPMVAAFLALSAWPAAGRRLPPLLGALLVGVAAIALSGRYAPGAADVAVLVTPVLQMPVFSWRAMIELVVPLAITVLVVQNGQGVAVLRAAGHDAPVSAVTIGCGLWSLVTAWVGTVSTCLTGPTNAILSSSGERHRQYTGGLLVGLLALVFGLLSPLATQAMLASPPAFIATLAGLAMLRVLQGAFGTAFGGGYPLGATVTFLVTVADIAILNVGAAFWGLLAGGAVGWLLERPRPTDGR